VTKPVISIRSWQAVHDNAPFNKVITRAIIIRNAEDVFCTPSIASDVKNRVVLLPGHHDDCWYDPNPYVELVKAEYQSLSS
jgi:hypothetical protein